MRWKRSEFHAYRGAFRWGLPHRVPHRLRGCGMSDTADGLRAIGVDPARLFNVRARNPVDQAAIERMNAAAAALIEADIFAPLLPHMGESLQEFADILEGMARSRGLLK
jgi:hypothetical protein